MKKKLLFIIPAVAIVGITLLSNTNEKFEKYHKDGIDIVNFSSNPNLGLTGAPGEANCTQCHSGSTQSAAGNVNLTAPSEYMVGQTYNIEIGVIGNAVNGFEMTILDGNGIKAGSLTAGGLSSVASSGGKEYIRHSTKTGFWTFTWTAPAADMGDLTAYYAVAKTDNGGTSSNDVIYLGQHVIASATTNGVSDYEKQDTKINMFFNGNSEELVVKYNLTKKANIQLNISDLSGKLIKTTDLGQKSFGPHTENIDLTDVQAEGIYFVSLFVNNNVYNRKVYLK
jgi:hypothetical protein